MAKLMSKKTKEIVQTTAVLVVAVLFILLYIIYPLIVIPGLTARPDRKKFENRNFHPANDPSAFVAAGLMPDTLSIISDDNIHLAALYFGPEVSPSGNKGTIILLHPDDTDRTSLIDYVRPLLDSGLSVILYDQRAYGLTGGRYHSAGNLEADDLVEVISFLSLRGKLSQPLLIVGFDAGADAALNAAQNEKRISAVVAINPYLNSTRWLAEKKSKNGALSIPFYKSVYAWWYQKLSGYPMARSNIKEMNPVNSRTILIEGQVSMNSPEVLNLREISPPNFLTEQPRPKDTDSLRQMILESIYLLAGNRL